MQFSEPIRELFDEIGNYLPRGKTGAAAVALTGLTLFSGCHKDKKADAPNMHGLEIGERLTGVDAWVENQENPHTGNIDQSYVYVSFAGSGSPPGTVGSAKNSDVVLIGFYAGSPKDAEKMAYRLERSTMEIKNLEPKSFHLMPDGSWMYLSDNDDVMIRKTSLEGTNPELPKPLPKPHNHYAPKKDQSQTRNDYNGSQKMDINVHVDVDVRQPRTEYRRPQRTTYVTNNYCTRRMHPMPRSNCMRCHY